MDRHGEEIGKQGMKQTRNIRRARGARKERGGWRIGKFKQAGDKDEKHGWTMEEGKRGKGGD